jgi:hypothetical protein
MRAILAEESRRRNADLTNQFENLIEANLVVLPQVLASAQCST